MAGDNIRGTGRDLREFLRTEHRDVHKEMAELRRALTRSETQQQRNQKQMLELVQRLHEEHFRALEKRMLDGTFFRQHTPPSSVPLSDSRESPTESKKAGRVQSPPKSGQRRARGVTLGQRGRGKRRWRG